MGITTPSSGSTTKILCGGSLKLASITPPGNYYYVNSTGTPGWNSTLPANTTPIAVVHERNGDKYLTYLGELAMKIDLATANTRISAVETVASTNESNITATAASLSSYETANDAALASYVASNDLAVGAIDTRLGSAETSVGSQGSSISAISDQLNTIDPDGVTNNNVQSVTTSFTYGVGPNAQPIAGNFVRLLHDGTGFYPVLCWSDSTPGEGYAIVRQATDNGDGSYTFDLITQGRAFVNANILSLTSEQASAEVYLATFADQASASAASYTGDSQWTAAKPSMSAGDFYGVGRAIRSTDSDYPNQIDLASYLVTNA